MRRRGAIPFSDYAFHAFEGDDRYLQYNSQISIVGLDGFLCTGSSSCASNNVQLEAVAHDEVPSQFERCQCGHVRTLCVAW